jgi:FKBP-type peptidyl-prolyl cis-trans isomerase
MAALAIVGCGSSASQAPEASKLTKLEKTDTVVGKGPAAEKGDTLLMHYKGTLMNGRVFDENKKDDEPLSFILGAGGVIQGWDQGMVGMKQGGKRTLKVPAALGYGPTGSGDKIPPNSDLNFDLELVKLIKAEDANTVTAKILQPGTGRPAKDGDIVKLSVTAKTFAGTELIQSDGIVATLGKNEIASRGLEAGIDGMKVGEVRELTVPPGMGMPPNPQEMMRRSSRPGYQIFTVKLLSLKPST